MKKKRLYTYGSILVLAAVAYFLFFRSGSTEIIYRTEKVARGDVVVNVRATGTLNPVQTVEVGSQVTGTIAALYADFNSVVKKGQVIAHIDSTFLYASVKEAEANLERNKAQLNEATRNYARMRELFEKDLISQAELDAAQTAFEAASAQLRQAEAALDRARVNLRYSVIRSPIDGVVISRDVDVGQTVAASLQAPRLFLIANDLSKMQVEASVDEADIGNIRVGQEVAFTVDAYPQETFRGTVSQVRLAPVTIQNVVTYTVIIDVPNPDHKLRPGMTATVSILIDKREDVLRIPVFALRFQPPQNVLEKILADEERRAGAGQVAVAQEESQSPPRPGGGRPPAAAQARSEKRAGVAHVWVLEGGKTLKRVAVHTGLNDTRFIEVVGGELTEGDDVVVGVVGGTATPSSQPANPFAPQMPRGTRRM